MPRKGRTHKNRISKKHSMKRRRTLKGGYYGASGAIAPGAMEWSRGSEMGGWSISSRGGNAIYGSGRKGRKGKKGGQEDGEVVAEADIDLSQNVEPVTAEVDITEEPVTTTAEADLAAGRRRRRRSAKKGIKGKKSKKSMKRKHRGGAAFGAVAASYQGEGSRGLADYAQTNTKYPPFGGAQYGAFNNAGAQPGSGFGSFIRAN